MRQSKESTDEVILKRGQWLEEREPKDGPLWVKKLWPLFVKFVYRAGKDNRAGLVGRLIGCLLAWLVGWLVGWAALASPAFGPGVACCL